MKACLQLDAVNQTQTRPQLLGPKGAFLFPQKHSFAPLNNTKKLFTIHFKTC